MQSAEKSATRNGLRPLMELSDLSRLRQNVEEVWGELWPGRPLGLSEKDDPYLARKVAWARRQTESVDL